MDSQAAPQAITGDARFFRCAGPHTLAAVADAAGATAAPRQLMLFGVAPLQTAAEGQVSFLDNRKYAAELDKTRASAVIVHPDMASRVPEGAAAIVTAQPYVAWAKVAALGRASAPHSLPLLSARLAASLAQLQHSMQSGAQAGGGRRRHTMPAGWMGRLLGAALAITLHLPSRNHGPLSSRAPPAIAAPGPRDYFLCI